MKKLTGLLLVMFILYGTLLATEPASRSAGNHVNMARRIGQLGIISLGAGALIVTGGIDLSVGSFIGLCSTVLAVGISQKGWSPTGGVAAVLGLGVVAGVAHGLLVTKLRLQPFVVTLCGLFIYRGLARWIAADSNAGLGSGNLEFRRAFSLSDWFGVPIEFVYLIGMSLLFAVLLHRSIYGRYLFAIGSNELAAKYSGIHVDRYKIFAYILCSVCAAFFSVMDLAESASVQPSSTGSLMELYAIAGAVLGGCSLRGGDGNVLGIVIGTTILTMLKTAVFFWGVPDALEYTAIGGALLLGAVLDEYFRRRNPTKRTT